MRRNICAWIYFVTLASFVGGDVELASQCQATSWGMVKMCVGQGYSEPLIRLRGGFQKGLDPSELMKSITRSYAGEELQRALQNQIQKKIQAKVQNAVSQNLLQVQGHSLVANSLNYDVR